MKKLDFAFKCAVILTIVFYLFAKIVGYIGPSNWGGSGFGKIVMPVTLNIIVGLSDINHLGAGDAAYLCIQVAGLGLALISVVVAYTIRALRKELERR